MNNMPKPLREQLAVDPLYKLCLRNEALHDHICQPNPLNGRLIEWEHALIFAGKQVQKRHAIVPICWWAHSGPGMKKDINIWIALNRATTEEMLELSNGGARDYYRYRSMLNKRYGAYEEPKPLTANGINYGFALTEPLFPDLMEDYAEPYGRDAYLVGSESDPEGRYVVDFEGDEGIPVVCNCDAFIIGKHRPCKHIRLAAVARQAKTV